MIHLSITAQFTRSFSKDSETTPVVHDAAARLSRLAAVVLGTAARDHALGNDVSANFRSALGVFCETAQGSDVQPEKLIILLKTLWRRRPDVVRMDRAEADRALAGTITRCIKEYFAPRRPSIQQRGRTVRKGS